MRAGARQRSRRREIIIILQIERKALQQFPHQFIVFLPSTHFLPPHWSSPKKSTPRSGQPNMNNWQYSDIHCGTTDWSDQHHGSSWDFERNRHRQYSNLETSDSVRRESVCWRSLTIDALVGDEEIRRFIGTLMNSLCLRRHRRHSALQRSFTVVVVLMLIGFVRFSSCRSVTSRWEWIRWHRN